MPAIRTPCTPRPRHATPIYSQTRREQFHTLCREVGTHRRQHLNELLDTPEATILDGAVRLYESSLHLESLGRALNDLSHYFHNLAEAALNRSAAQIHTAENIAFNRGDASFFLRLIEDAAADQDFRASSPESHSSFASPPPTYAPGDHPATPIDLTIADFDVPIPDVWVYCHLCDMVRPPHAMGDCHLFFRLWWGFVDQWVGDHWA